MALLNIIKQLNWFDIFFAILLFRIGYIALKSGLPIELFKLLGTISAVYLPMHYYIRLAEFISSRISIVKIPPQILDFISFIILAIAGYFIFMLLRSIFCRFIKMEATPKLDKWGGFLLGAIRGFLLASLIMFIFVISPAGYLRKSVDNAYSGRQLFEIAPATYKGLWNGLVSKFVSNEKFNQAILEVRKEFPRK